LPADEEDLHSACQSVGMFACTNSMKESNGHDALQPTQQIRV